MHRPIRRRQSTRLRGYDRQGGAYFVTLCTERRRLLFGDVSNAEVQLNAIGQLVSSTWSALPDHYVGVGLDAFVVMPNHLHGLVVLSADAVISLPEVVHRFKSLTATRWRQMCRPAEESRLWQRNYYDHVVRNEIDLARIRQYIAENPARWAEDPEHPARPA